MSSPTLYTAAQIKAHDAYVLDGRTYIPARPLSWGGLSLKARLHLAWGVFIGRYDALDWQAAASDKHHGATHRRGEILAASQEHPHDRR